MEEGAMEEKKWLRRNERRREEGEKEMSVTEEGINRREKKKEMEIKVFLSFYKIMILCNDHMTLFY